MIQINLMKHIVFDMPHITRLKQVKRRCIILIINFIFIYNSHYIHSKEVIMKISISYKHLVFREYKFITLKNHLEIIFARH